MFLTKIKIRGVDKMIFCGSSTKIVDDNGIFRLPAFWRDIVKPGMKYNIVIVREDWNKELYYIRYSFAERIYEEEILISSGVVNEDKVFKIPDEYIELMKGSCYFFGTFEAFEVSKVSVEMLSDGIEEPKELNITFE